MLWQEDKPKEDIIVSTNVVDIAFTIDCRCLPLDHAYNLSHEICTALPWFEQEPLAGLHLIRGGESNHGWHRPESPDSILYLSHRIKLTLRLPETCIDKAQALCGMTLDIDGYPLHIKTAKVKPIRKVRNLLARHIITESEISEETFVDNMVIQLTKSGIDCRKAVCGKTDNIKTPTGNLFTRSLMLADLEPKASILVQQQGLGTGRKIGCGIFVAHKGMTT
ncbi:type I-MYXAN CRISPR-associated protein Cas6/Cmx6 [Candidatus Halobeggiatoa sp. HSG11]|nr:type I-MYXAN CRISPR-associated protein Cas6/Cmx6 [Candidatus Halobeggiatoa sp. HSG11]